MKISRKPFWQSSVSSISSSSALCNLRSFRLAAFCYPRAGKACTLSGSGGGAPLPPATFSYKVDPE